MHPRQRSKCSTTVSVSSIDPSTRPLIRWMRPRGESISSCHRVYVGHEGRQKPQCTQSAISSGCTEPPGRVRRAGSRRAGRPSRRTRRAGLGARGARVRRPSAYGRGRPACSSRTSSHGSTRSPPSAAACSATACAAPSNRTYIRSATTSTALGTRPERCSSPQRSAPTPIVAAAAGQGCSRSASRSTVPSLPAEPQ